MTQHELNDHLAALRLTQAEAAQLLGVSARTLRRWLEGEEVPGPAQAALHAWRRLAERNLPWKPDSVSIVEDDQDQIARHRLHTIGLSDLLARVEARGGARIPWTVSITEGEATLGPVEVAFYKLQSEGFSVSSYRRKDTDPDVHRDWPLIEDAIFCIAREFENCRGRAAALTAVAEYVRRNSALFVRSGPRLPAPLEVEQQRHRIEAGADKIDTLAIAAANGAAKYHDFESILGELRRDGFSADGSLVSAVARAFTTGAARPRTAPGKAVNGNADLSPGS
jgi:transcriptional regulator with XRE-family HTH domain